MTIDMHRDTSLRESVAFALFDSRHEKLRLPSSADRSRYTATRNLPTDNPVRAVATMESLVASAPSLKRKRRWRATKATAKPALCYTVYWEADLSKQTQIKLIDQSLRYLHADHLQTLFVGRNDYPKRTMVIVNVVDHEGMVGINDRPYYELMRWHLCTINDQQASRSLAAGLSRTTIDSLRRQDHRLLNLPPLFNEAVRGVPGFYTYPSTLRTVHRSGPGTLQESEFSHTVHNRLDQIEKTFVQYRQMPPDFAQLLKNKRRKRNTRRKILVGELMLDRAEYSPELCEDLHRSLNCTLTDPQDRALFSLDIEEKPPKPKILQRSKDILTGFHPKKHRGRWCAAYGGDPESLPHNLIGFMIEVRVAVSTYSWITPIVEVMQRTVDSLIVRTPPKSMRSHP